MERKSNISEYRERLDRTLSSDKLANDDVLKTLVKKKILRSLNQEIEEYIDNVVEIRTKEVSNFLSMLRSTSVQDVQRSSFSETTDGGWKIKQDTEELRVMYREGPEGTPFHTLLVEGYVDGPIDACLCISIESELYTKWWPQIVVPTFKVTASKCLQKIRIGEQICLVRMKLPWPLSTREAVVHYFVFEHFQDDLVVVLLNSIPELESIDSSSCGFKKDGIPEAQNTVRINVVGGFAMQKVTAERSYFRTIANMDLKLDFVPPAFINFMSRQLVGNGFKLYKKEVASVSNGNEKFFIALKDPLYTWIREALYSGNKLSALEPEVQKIDTFIHAVEHQTETRVVDEEVCPDDHVTHSAIVDSELLSRESLNKTEVEDEKMALVKKSLDEIEEIEVVNVGCPDEDDEPNKTSCDQVEGKYNVNNKKRVVISSEVEKALGTLERAISIFREHGYNLQPRTLPGTNSERLLNVDKEPAKCSKASEDSQVCSNYGTHIDLSNNELGKKTPQQPKTSFSSHSSRRVLSNSYSKEANQNRIAPASPDRDSTISTEDQQISQRSMESIPTDVTSEDKIPNDVNGTAENHLPKRKNKKFRSHCLYRLFCVA